MERIAPAPVGRLASPALRAMAESLPEIDHYELDGIPLFHLPAGGATILTLAFGVGRAHEPVVHGGMTHLAEHLILTAIDRALDHSNGSTEPFRVTFTVRGSPADATRFLKDVCDQIARPRLSRMHEEANVLRSEAALRKGSVSIEGQLHLFRLGYQGLGKVELPELFLSNLDERVLGDWIAQHFVAGNAALWVMGQLPDDLLITLEPGPRTPPPALETVPGFQGPTMVKADVGGIGASFEVDRGLAIQVALRSVEQRLKKALRVDRGLGYALVAEYRPVSPGKALAWIIASSLPEKVAEVQRAVLETIDDVAARGPSEDEIAGFYETMVRDGSDPMAFPVRLDSQTSNLLLGIDPKPMSAHLDELWRLQPDEVAAAFRAARETMLLLLPSNAVPPNRAFKPYPPPISSAMGHGQAFQHVPVKGSGFDKRRPPVLFVGAEGMFVETRAGRFVTIPWADSVAVIRNQYVRVVLSRDGSAFTIAPDAWKNGYNAIALVDRYAPPNLTVKEG